MATLNTIRHRGEDGQAIVELALTLPLLLFVILGVFDFGLLFQRYELVTNAAREGARLAVLPEYTDPHQAEVRAANYLTAGGLTGPVSNGGPDCDAVSISGGTICITVTLNGTELIPAVGSVPAKTVRLAAATVTYDHEHIFLGPMLTLFGNTRGTVRLKAVSIMRREGT